MHEGLNPNIAVERHVKEEIRKREYAMDLERQIVERRKREQREKEMARAASRERIHHALNAPTAMIPSPSYASPRHKRIVSGYPARKAAGYNIQDNGNRNARELFPKENHPDREDDEVKALRSQLAKMQQKLNDIQSSESNNVSKLRQNSAAYQGQSQAHAQGWEEPVQYIDASNMKLAERSRHYEEDHNFKAPRVRLKFEEPDERLRLEADEAKKQQYARELQAQIAEKAARDKARKKEQDEYDMRHEIEAVKHNPFGKVGGGAPLRNAQGEVEPSLHMLRSPENVKGSNAYVNRKSSDDHYEAVDESKNMPALNFRQDNPFQSKEEREARSKLETDYQRALREQIEEKNKIKAAEAEKERLENEREEKRLAEEQKKMKEQYEKEQIRERMKREKALQENMASAAAASAATAAATDGQLHSNSNGMKLPQNDINDHNLEPNSPSAISKKMNVHEAEYRHRQEQVPAISQQLAPDGFYIHDHQGRKETQQVAASPDTYSQRPKMPNNELLSSMSRFELERLRQEFQRQQDAFEERIKDVVSEKESEMIDLRERAQFAEEDREAARTELEMIKAEIRFRKNVSNSL